jgi:hypothetical protein
MPMRGDDLVALREGREGGPPEVLKGEAKRGANVSASVIADACEALWKYDGRPNPTSLAFNPTKLRRQNQNNLAPVFEDVQAGPLPLETVSHLIFALCGNDPTKHLRKHNKSRIPKIARRLVAMVVNEHAEFVEEVYARP